MNKLLFLVVCVLVQGINMVQAQEEHHEESENALKRHKIGLFTGNTLIHDVHNTHCTLQDDFIIPCPKFGTS